MSENNVSTKATRNEDLVLTVPVDQVTQLVEENAIFMQPSELNAIVENIKQEVETKPVQAEFKAIVVDQVSEFDQILEDATAAGLGAGGENGGNSFVRLLRIVEETTPLSYEFPNGDVTTLLPVNNVAGAAEVPIVPEIPPVDPPPVDPPPVDPPPVDPPPVDPPPGPTATTLTLTATPTHITEAGENVLFTVTLHSGTYDTPTIVTLTNGMSITIPAGAIAASSYGTYGETDDPYIDPSYDDVSVVGVSNPNVTVVDPSAVTIFTEDTIDPTYVDVQLLADGNQIVEGDDVTFRFSVDNAPQGDLTLHTTMGDVTIKDGETFADLTTTSRPDENFYQGMSEVTVSVTGAEGGNYENLDFNTQATAYIVDDQDYTTGTLTGVSDLNHLGGTVTFSIELNGTDDFAPKSDLDFTLSNGDHITIKAGETSGSFVHTYTAEESVNTPDYSVHMSDFNNSNPAYEVFMMSGQAIVDNPYYVAPVVSIWNDSIDNGTFDPQGDNQPVLYRETSTSDDNDPGTDKIFIGDLLKESKAITPAQLAANPPAITVLEHTADITFTFLSEGAGYQNAVGWYDVLNPTVGHVVWENASAKGSDGTLKNDDSITFDNVPAGTQIGFFLIPDSYHIEGSIPDTVYFNDGHAYAKYKDGNYSKMIDGDDNMSGDSDPVWFSNGTNSDGLQHVITGVSSTDDPNVLYVGFEDLGNGGDKDYNDVVFKVDLGEGNNIYSPPVEFDVGVTITDVDSANMSKAVLSFSLDESDDVTYNLAEATDAGLTVTRVDDTFTITGDASILDYNDLLDSFHLVVNDLDSIQGPTVETRTATLQVWDETNQASNVDAAIFNIFIPPSIPDIKPPHDAC